MCYQIKTHRNMKTKTNKNLKQRRALQRARRRFLKNHPLQWDSPICKLTLQEIAVEVEHVMFQEDYFSTNSYYRRELLENETPEEYNKRLLSTFKAFGLEELAHLVGCV